MIYIGRNPIGLNHIIGAATLTDQSAANDDNENTQASAAEQENKSNSE